MDFGRVRNNADLMSNSQSKMAAKNTAKFKMAANFHEIFDLNV